MLIKHLEVSKISILLELELLGLPPTVNNMYRSRRNGIRYKTAATQQYQTYATGVIRDAWQGREAYGGAVSLDVKFCVRDRRRWDIDNRLKALQDCLMSGGVIEDDSQIEELYVRRERTGEAGTYIILRALE